MPRVDPTARIADGARIAGDVEIGPYCIVGPHAELRAGARLIAHVIVAGATVIGERTVVAPFASLGTAPQSIKYRGGLTRLVIGPDCDIREHVTMNIGTEDGGALTEIGAHCLFMVGSHVGHDCKVGNNATFANNAVLGGHVIVGDHVFVGGNSAAHQFVRIGEGAMIAGMTGVATDVIPFGFGRGAYGGLIGLNIVGLRRRKFAPDVIRNIRRAYRMLFLDGGVFADRFVRVENEFAGDQVVERICSFIRSGKSRPLMMPPRGTVVSPVAADGGS